MIMARLFAILTILIALLPNSSNPIAHTIYHKRVIAAYIPSAFRPESRFGLASNFLKKRLMRISLLPVNVKNDQNSYTTLQLILEGMLGKIPAWQKMQNFLSPCFQTSKWRISNGTITHTLSDRFGTEDVISILLNDAEAHSM